MKNAAANLLARPRFAAVQRKSKTVWSVFYAAVIAASVALPLLALSPEAHAEDARPASSTLKEIVTRGSVLMIEGADIDVTYTPDGKFTAMNGAVKGTWRIEGDTLCTTTSFQPVESCVLYPQDRKSGDIFEIMSEQGLVKIRIK
jgi:hypothetical protein